MRGFYNKTLHVISADGRNSLLVDPLIFVDPLNGDIYACPQGSWSDGISTPPEVWATDPPFGLQRWFTGILHDCSPKYRCTLLVWRGDHWAVPDMTREQCDALLKRAFISQGNSPAKAEIYFAALEAFGGSSSEGDLSLATGKLTVPPAPSPELLAWISSPAQAGS